MPIAAEMEGSAADPEFIGGPDSGVRDHRALSFVAAAGLLLPLQSVSGAFPHSAGVGLVGAALTGVIVVLIWLYATAGSGERLQQLDGWLLVTAIVIVVLAVAAFTDGESHYFSDEAALVHGATIALLHGHDPYGRNLSWALSDYGDRGVINLTYLLNGGVADQLNYPALPVLASLPIVAINQASAAVAFVVGAGSCVATATMFLVLPKQLRPLAVIVCADIPILIEFAGFGLNTAIMVGPLTVCAYRWGAVGSPGADGRGSLGRTGTIRALCLGLAAATNQLAWFIAPFLFLATFLSSRQRLGRRPALRVATSYGLTALLVFLIVNAPFIAWAPGRWLAGVLAPVTQHAVPLGEGLVGLTAIGRVGGGALSFYAYGSALLYAALLYLLWTRFERLGRCMMLLPLLALYTSDRSLDSYWLGPTAAVVVSIVCSGTAASRAAPATHTWVSRTGRRGPPEALRWAALLTPAIACFAIALGTPGPLALQIVGSHSGRNGSIDELAVVAHNSSDTSLKPHFALDTSGTVSGYWRVLRGPERLGAGATSTYLISAPFATAEPTPGSRYMLQVLTDTPQTMSSSVRLTAPRV